MKQDGGNKATKVWRNPRKIPEKSQNIQKTTENNNKQKLKKNCFLIEKVTKWYEGAFWHFSWRPEAEQTSTGIYTVQSRLQPGEILLRGYDVRIQSICVQLLPNMKIITGLQRDIIEMIRDFILYSLFHDNFIGISLLGPFFSTSNSQTFPPLVAYASADGKSVGTTEL